MLHAITQNKGNLYRRYLGHREADEVKVHEEDELTALLLGPLALLPENISAMFWGELLHRIKAPHVPDGYPCKAIMAFWPSRRGVRIEPDLEVKLTWSDGSKHTLLIELKWRAPLRPENQLQIQWNEYLSPEERKNGWHMFIGQETSQVEKVSKQEDVWGERLLPISWFALLGIINQTRGINGFDDLLPWIQQVTSALNRLGIRPFNGFSKIELFHQRVFTNGVFFGIN